MLTKQSSRGIIYVRVGMVIQRIDSDILFGKDALGLALAHQFIWNQLVILLLQEVRLIVVECDRELDEFLEFAVRATNVTFDPTNSMTDMTTV